MDYWERNMPAGMLLRSSWRASSISSPMDRFSLARYERHLGRPLPRPVPREDFVAYGHWFQRHAVPDVQRRRVTAIRERGDGFVVDLDDGTSVDARRVVLASGLATFAWRPAPFDQLPVAMVSHTSDHSGFAGFEGRRVLVVGGGQSAVESAALASEAGADVVLLSHSPVHWLTRSARLHGAAMGAGRAFYAPEDVGPAGLSWIVAMPGMLRQLPSGVRGQMTARCLQPAASHWLVRRLAAIPKLTGDPTAATSNGSGDIHVTLADGRVLHADHVLQGTGFRLSIERLGLLAPELAATLRHVNGYPVLSRGFEASVPGLHILGGLAAYSYGPVMRFVSGTWYAAPALARAMREADRRGRRNGRERAGTARRAAGSPGPRPAGPTRLRPVREQVDAALRRSGRARRGRHRDLEPK
jgi:thioredoxin reductase